MPSDQAKASLIRSSISEDDIQFNVDDSLLETEKPRSWTRWRSGRLGEGELLLTWTNFLMLQTFFVAIYTAILFFLRPSQPNLVYSPARSAIKYENVRFNATLVIDSPYNGPPSEEVDKAWHDLLDNMNIAVPKSDLDRIGSESIQIPGTDDMYFAGLSVFHELHCLKRLRQYTWLDDYFPNATKNDMRLNRLHTDHCIEVLRQAIMCRADITLFTLQWSEDSPRPRADFSQEHNCVNWDTIWEWAQQRKVDASQPGLLTHPYKGVAFPDGKGNKIGGSEDHSHTVHEG